MRMDTSGSQTARRTSSSSRGKQPKTAKQEHLALTPSYRNQVSPAELENVLLSHPLVREAGVCAKWDSVQETEVPVGYINLQASVKEADRAKVIKEIMDFVNGRVSKTKRLRGGLYYLQTFPRSSTGKLLRRALPARLEADRAARL